MKATRFTVLPGLMLLVFVSLNSCAIFSQSYQPDSYALSMAEELEQQDQLTIEKKYLRLDPAPATAQGSGTSHSYGIIFYPGAKVAPLAYLPLWERFSREGYTVFIADMPLDFAFLRINAAADIQQQYPDIRNWIISGHSLGGAMAAEHLKKNWQNFDALVLIGSYPGSSTDLSEMAIPVLSIREELGLPDSQEKADAVRGNLPPETIFEIIPGANHAQYGNYGVQRNDGQALISREEQQEITSDLVLTFLAEQGISPR
ncbi:alpha/beta hydrolase [Spirochaeta dissipatitropha]